MSRTIRNRHNRGNCWWLGHPTYSEIDDYYVKFNKKAHRDGVLHDKLHNIFKEFADAERRCYQRNFLTKIRYYDIEDISYPNEKDQKHIWWDID
jgi:hypothetical protein